MATDKEKEQKRASLSPLRTLFPYILRYPKLIIGAGVFLLLAAATTLTLPLAVRRVIDFGFSSQDPEFINSYFTFLMGIAIVLGIASAMRYYFVILLGERVISDLRSDVFTHIARLSPSFYDVNRSGEIISRLTADTTQIKSAVGATASMALRNSILCLGAIVMMFWTSWTLSLFVVIGIPIVVIPLIAFGRAVRKRSRNAQDTLADTMGFASEAINATRTLQAFNSEDRAIGRFSSAIEDTFDAAKAAITTRAALTVFSISLVFCGVVGILWSGAHSVLEGDMSAGTLGQFLLYSVLAAGSLGGLSEVWGELSQASGAAERLSELLNERSEIEDPVNPVALPENVKGEIEFKSVSFAYPTRPNAKILDDLSFSVKTGETVAIVGPSGAGKSTLFSLVLRFYDPSSGQILIDGVDVKEALLHDIRSRAAIVPQDVTIFAASVAENIAFGSNEASDEDIKQAGKSALVEKFALDMDNGYDSEIGERGVTLSGGQRQRVAIARGMLKNAPILLLDEATSALDAQSEKLVQQALDRIMENRTTLIIAHRLSTILKADRILVMDKGKIIEEGTHKSLSEANGMYANLAKLQFQT
ncbi:ABC transporter transmembrane domain-containing protein [Lentilitoribacter sp. EG35]|uniref:ABC transporter transmembrane domain-containing protein n=1 Tax=Lentilitoribacter sp. EG35 TaxID=3234192 RepID=UPI003B969AB8